MNRARALLRDEGERIQLAQLNLLAGRLARSSLAPERALALLESGLAVLPPGVEAESSSRQGLRFALYRDAVAAASTLGTTEPGARLFAEAMKHVPARPWRGRSCTSCGPPPASPGWTTRPPRSWPCKACGCWASSCRRRCPPSSWTPSCGRWR